MSPGRISTVIDDSRADLGVAGRVVVLELDGAEKVVARLNIWHYNGFGTGVVDLGGQVAPPA
jgi:hypothetical protein